MTGKYCSRCGYDLTGLDFEGRCPECGGFYDNWSNQGIKDTGVMAKHRRGDWVVRLMQVIGLVFAALVILGIGALYFYKYGGISPIIVTAFFALIFLISAASTALSLRKW